MDYVISAWYILMREYNWSKTSLRGTLKNDMSGLWKLNKSVVGEVRRITPKSVAFLKRTSLLGTRSMHNLCGYPGKRKSRESRSAWGSSRGRGVNRYGFVYVKEAKLEALIGAQVGVIASFCGKWKVYLAKVALSYKNGCKKYALEKRNAKEYR